MIVDIPQIKSRGARFSLVAQDIVETLSTGGEVVAPQGVQLWHYSFPLVAQTYEEAQEWMGALCRLVKMGTVFPAIPPGFDPPEYVKKYRDGNTWTTGTSFNGQPLLDGANQTGSSIDVTNLVANETFLQRGDYMALIGPNHTELKIVTADSESDSTGHATVQFTPPIRVAPTSTDVINIVNPGTLFRLSRPEFVYNLQPNRIVNMTIDAVESYGITT